MDAETVYRLSNFVLALLHAALTVAFVWCAWGRSRSSVVAVLCWPLVLFFATGCLTHTTNLFDDAATSLQAWALLARSLLVGVVVLPVLTRAVRGARALPTKEQYAQALTALEEAIRRKDLEADARKAFQTQLEGRNRRLNEVCDELRGQVEALRREVLTDFDYQELRRKIHALRNA